MNCVLYARVSTDKQADRELSIPAQLEAMRAHAHTHGWRVVSEFVEAGVSGTTAARPALQQMLARLQEPDATIGVVLVHKIDRLARNVYDHAMVRAVLKQRQVQLASVVENVDDSVSGQLVENIMASIAEFYSANLGQEVRKGMRQKVLRGGWPHRAPLGYINAPPGVGSGASIVAHPRIGPLIAQAFELYGTGLYSPKRLAQRLTKDGLTTRGGGPLAPSHLREILSNGFYAGRVRWHDLDVEGAHVPLVSREVFARVQQILRERSHARGRKGSLQGVPLRGIAICALCRGHMTAERHERWLYYRCSRQAYRRDRCRAKFCNADRAHAGLKRLCLRLQITRKTAQEIGASARQVLATRRGDSVGSERDRQSRARELLTHEMDLTEAFAAGELPADEYEREARRIATERDGLDVERVRTSRTQDDVLRDLQSLLHLATSLWDVYEPLSDARRAELLRQVFSTITLGSDGVSGFALTAPFKALFSGADLRSSDIASQLLDPLISSSANTAGTRAPNT